MLKVISKLPEEIPRPLIGTHNASFHCDEVVAVYLLKLLPEYSNGTVLRTRNLEDLDKCDIVVDVGGRFSEVDRQFDHHQRGFTETWSEERKKTLLSSAGLVWKYYGKAILETAYNVSDQNTIQALHQLLYDLIFESVDANDNGVRGPCKHDRKYVGGMPGMGGLVARHNTSWNDPSRMDETEAFIRASESVRESLSSVMSALVQNYQDIRSEIENALNNPDLDLDPSGRVIVLPKWINHVGLIPYFFKESHKNVCCVVTEDFDDDARNSWICRFLPISDSDRTPRGKYELSQVLESDSNTDSNEDSTELPPSKRSKLEKKGFEGVMKISESICVVQTREILSELLKTILPIE